MRHVVELHKVVHEIYDKELEEYEKHEERLRERQSNSSLFLDMERTAKTGFAFYHVEANRGRKVRNLFSD